MYIYSLGYDYIPQEYKKSQREFKRGARYLGDSALLGRWKRGSRLLLARLSKSWSCSWLLSESVSRTKTNNVGHMEIKESYLFSRKSKDDLSPLFITTAIASAFS